MVVKSVASRAPALEYLQVGPRVGPRPPCGPAPGRLRSFSREHCLVLRVCDGLAAPTGDGEVRGRVMSGSQPRCTASHGESPVRDEIGIASDGRLDKGCQRGQSITQAAASWSFRRVGCKFKRLRRPCPSASSRAGSCAASAAAVPGLPSLDSPYARSSGDSFNHSLFLSGPVGATRRTPGPVPSNDRLIG